MPIATKIQIRDATNQTKNFVESQVFMRDLKKFMNDKLNYQYLKLDSALFEIQTTSSPQDIIDYFYIKNINRKIIYDVNSKAEVFSTMTKMSNHQTITSCLDLTRQLSSQHSDLKDTLESIGRLLERFKNGLIVGQEAMTKSLLNTDNDDQEEIQDKFKAFLTRKIKQDILIAIFHPIYEGMKFNQKNASKFKAYTQLLKQLNALLSEWGIFTDEVPKFNDSKEYCKAFDFDYYVPRSIEDGSTDTTKPYLKECFKEVHRLPYFFGNQDNVIIEGEATVWRYI